MKHWKDTLIKLDTTIQKVIQTIENSTRKIAFVVDKNNILKRNNSKIPLPQIKRDIIV